MKPAQDDKATKKLKVRDKLDMTWSVPPALPGPLLQIRASAQEAAVVVVLGERVDADDPALLAACMNRPSPM